MERVHFQATLQLPVEPVVTETERKAGESKAKVEKAQEVEKEIVFESMDFERLEEVPKY